MRIHPTAMIESGVTIGEGSSVWDHAHIRHGTTIGRECVIGGKATIAYDVRIGDRVKINSNVYICTAVTIEDGVMISAGVIFTNDRFPRATTPDLQQALSSDPNEHTLQTRVCEGATIGAGAIIGCDLQLGRFSMIGMGSVVTRTVDDFCLAIGNPARVVGYVCRCGQPIARFEHDRRLMQSEPLECPCSRRYAIDQGTVRELPLD